MTRTEVTRVGAGRPRPAVVLVLVGLANLAPLVDGLVGPGWYLAGPMVLGSALSGYALGALTGPRTATAGVLLSVALLTAANQLDSDLYHWLDDVVFFTVVVGGPALAGAAVVTRARQVRELRSLRTELAAQRAAELDTARLEERARVHDQAHRQLAQRLGAIAMRADGASRSPSRAEEALVEIEEAARTALDDLREALGALRVPDRDSEPPHGAADAGDEADDDAGSEAGGPRPPVTVVDAALVLACGAAMGMETLLVEASRGPGWANVLAALAVAAPLGWRRAHPVAATAAFGVLGAAMSLWLTPLALMVTPLAPAIATAYAIGAWSRRWWWVPGLLVHWSALVAIAWAADDLGGDAEGALPVIAFSAAGLAAGRITAGWGARVQRIAAAVEALEGARGTDVRRAVAREREALASALHDSVAHALTVACVQAGAARRTGAARASDLATERALRTIAGTARASLAELRTGLDRLDDPGGPLDRAGISALARDVGVDVDAQLPGDLELRGPVAGLAYRVLRETLVNAARHAPGARVSVRVELRAEDLLVEVVDGGGAPSGFTAGSGRGLSGLAAEIGAAGGRMWWAPAGPGFRVEVVVPVAPRLVPRAAEPAR